MGGRAISRRRFLVGLAGAGLGVAAAGLWLARRAPTPSSLPSPATIAAEIRTEYLRAWDAYKQLAWGHDELRPVSGTHQEFFAPNHPVGLTIVEALDTLYLMGLDDELALGVRWVEDNLNLDIDAPFQVFETIIRMLGGLLAGHLATKNAALLTKAKELADRLLPAFTKSPTGMPYRYVNLNSGAVSVPANFIAEIGTNLSELGMLSRLTGDDRYFQIAKRAAQAVYERRSALDLIATTINVETGRWLSTVSVGPQPPVDSYYEYLLDGYQLFGDTDLLAWFRTLTAALQSRQWDAEGGRKWYRRVLFQTGTLVDNHESELAAFWAGSLAEAGMKKEADEYLDSFTSVLDRYGIFPEEWDYTDMSIVAGGYQLRPEYADSCLALFVASGGSELYRQRAYRLYQAMKANCRVENGYTILTDITTRPMTLGDLTPGYWFSENMKYFYLLFSNTPRFDYHHNYLTTEGKVLLGLK
jgi:hypothetical protein